MMKLRTFMFYIIKQIDTPIVQRVAFIITILGLVVMMYISFLFLQTSNPLKMVQPYKVISYSVGQGGILNYEVEYCSDRDFFLVFNRQLENINTGELWDVSDIARHLTKGCSKEQRSVQIPVKIDVGTYKLRTTVTIKINSIRTEQFDFESESFGVGSY